MSMTIAWNVCNRKQRVQLFDGIHFHMSFVTFAQATQWVMCTCVFFLSYGEKKMEDSRFCIILMQTLKFFNFFSALRFKFDATTLTDKSKAVELILKRFYRCVHFAYCWAACVNKKVLQNFLASTRAWYESASSNTMWAHKVNMWNPEKWQMRNRIDQRR